MLALLIGVGLSGVLLVVGLGLAVAFAVHPRHHRTATGTSGTRTATAVDGAARTKPDAPAGEDALAARTMPSVDADAFQPSPVSTQNPGPAIGLPPATSVGLAAVPTGFPETAAGALAQLAAIDQTALQSGSVVGARAVITGWALPGGPTPTSWSGVAGMAALLNAAGLPGGGDPQLAVVLTPLMGQIKGTVGTGFVIPCVDFEVDVTLAQTVRGASADCQRMVWTPAESNAPSRWMVGPGAEPATAPSVWPDTALAISVGYRDLRQDTPHG